jgi:hypothetical protein
MPTTKAKPAGKKSTSTKKGSTKKPSTPKKKTPAKKTSTSKSTAAKKKPSAKRSTSTKRTTSSRKPARKGILEKAKDALSGAAGAIAPAAKKGLQVGTVTAAATLAEEVTSKSNTSRRGGSKK